MTMVSKGKLHSKKSLSLYNLHNLRHFHHLQKEALCITLETHKSFCSTAATNIGHNYSNLSYFIVLECENCYIWKCSCRPISLTALIASYWVLVSNTKPGSVNYVDEAKSVRVMRSLNASGLLRNSGIAASLSNTRQQWLVVPSNRTLNCKRFAPPIIISSSKL